MAVGRSRSAALRRRELIHDLSLLRKRIHTEVAAPSIVSGGSREPACCRLAVRQGDNNVAYNVATVRPQREYDATSGFMPVPAEEYVAWYRAIADNVVAVLFPAVRIS